MANSKDASQKQPAAFLGGSQAPLQRAWRKHAVVPCAVTQRAAFARNSIGMSVPSYSANGGD